jgi:hypothetical protein
VDISAMVNKYFDSRSFSWDLAEGIYIDGIPAILGKKNQDSRLLSK